MPTLPATISQAVAFIVEVEAIWTNSSFNANDLVRQRATPLGRIAHNNQLDQDMVHWMFADGSSVLVGVNGAEVRHVAN